MEFKNFNEYVKLTDMVLNPYSNDMHKALTSNNRNFDIYMKKTDHKLYFFKYYKVEKATQLIADFNFHKIISYHQYPKYFPLFTDGGNYEDAFYLVMPYYKNGDLQQVLCKKKASKVVFIDEQYKINSFKTKIAYQLADALSILHKDHIIHYDIKPQNILIDDNNDLLLIDYGISQIEHHSNSPQILSKSIEQNAHAQTLHYAERERTVCTATDIYSYGRVLCFMLDPHAFDFLELDKIEEEYLKNIKIPYADHNTVKQDYYKKINEFFDKNKDKYKSPELITLIKECIDITDKEKRPKAHEIKMRFEKREVFFGSKADLPVTITNPKFFN